MIKIGDTIKFRGAFGTGSVETAEVLNIMINCPHKEEGTDVAEYEKAALMQMGRKAVLDLSGDRWIYGSQIV